MENPQYAYQVFKRHFESAPFARRSSFIHLELGPGTSLASAMIGHAFGAAGAYLIDIDDIAVKGLEVYCDLAQFLTQKKLPGMRSDQIISLDGLLRICHARYLTNGLQALRAIPTASVDFIWSHAVLQHVKLHEFYDTMVELRRILCPDGACSHIVDFTDMLGGALNHLRFREDIWESSFLMRSGFYTNRLRRSEMVSLCRRAGFEVQHVEVRRWEKLPMPKRKLQEHFQAMPLEELLIRSCHIVLTPLPAAPLLETTDHSEYSI
jgi:hypothetical protein